MDFSFLFAISKKIDTTGILAFVSTVVIHLQAVIQFGRVLGISQFMVK